MRFGEELRQNREQRGISLSDVSVSTRVSPRHIEALEAERFADLPGGVFNRGIVRSYAQHCGLDAEGTVTRFLHALQASGVTSGSRDDDWVEFAEAVRRNRANFSPPQRMRWIGVGVMLLLVFTLAAGSAWLLWRRGLLQVPPRVDSVIRHLGVT